MKEPKEKLLDEHKPVIEKATAILSAIYGGKHNIPGKLEAYGPGVAINVQAHRLSTFDFSGLTALVVLAHEHCCRVELGQCGPGRPIKLIFHNRKGREGAMHERHPDIDTAVALHRIDAKPNFGQVLEAVNELLAVMFFSGCKDGATVDARNKLAKAIGKHPDGRSIEQPAANG